MEAIFKAWETSRKLFLNFFDSYTIDQLNKIPAGFNNNLIWNIGHIIVAQQALIYKGSNLPMHISDELFNRYKPGTQPTGNTSQAEVEELKELLFSVIPKTKEDFNNGIFTTYVERTTVTGFHLASVTDAFEFNNYHEGVHLGYTMAIKKLI
jgi:hypothetical protein